jgi:hypothetical protein
MVTLRQSLVQALALMSIGSLPIRTLGLANNPLLGTTMLKIANAGLYLLIQFSLFCHNLKTCFPPFTRG